MAFLEKPEQSDKKNLQAGERSTRAMSLACV